MNLLRDAPIQRKLTAVLMLASTVTLLLASTSMVVWQWFHVRATIVHDLSIQARILAANCTASVAFNDAATANELLSALRIKPHLTHARLELPDGATFAEYVAPSRPRTGEPHASGTGLDLTGAYLTVVEPVLLDGKRLAHLRLEFAFAETRREIVAPYVAITSVIFVANLLLAFFFSARLQRLISLPILKLSAAATRIAEHEDYSVRAEPGGRDELGRLTLAFNTMLARIEAGDTALRRANADLAAEMAGRAQLNRELIALSRRAGMAEVASGVLHNVGNALNSINVSATIVQDQLAASELSNLLRAAELIRAHPTDLPDYIATHPKGRHLPQFIVEVSEALAAEHTTWREELSALAKNISHIKDIVTAQQSYGKVAGVIERLAAHTLVEDALRLIQPAIERLGLTPVCELQPVPEVSVDKHKVLQILVNLLKNAVDALRPLPPDRRQLLVSLAPAGPDRIRIAVIDHGVGIPPANLRKIFTHGFTTRPDGHGFGLHAAALAARELEGSLTVHSAGAGHGATFTLELPLHPSPSATYERE